MAYSKEIESAIKKSGAGIGSRISVGGKEGILMPSPEITGSPGFLIIKLDSGYNIGVKFNGSLEKSKTPEPAAVKAEYDYETKEKHAHVRGKPKPGLPKLSLISIGGTIASKIDYKTGGVYAALTPEDLLAQVPELVDIAAIDMSAISEIMSEDMCHENWVQMAHESERSLNSGSAGVVFTHGTDTMHFSSAALSFMLPNVGKPVVLTGAQRSSDRGSADSAMNLVCSMHAAKSGIAEVGICMHGTTNDDYCFFLRGTKVRKMHSTMRSAFRPINDYPMAKVFPDGRMEEFAHKKRTDAKVKADTKFEPNVALVKAYPGADPKVLDFHVSNGCRGIIIEALALGHVPTPKAKMPWTPVIKDIVSSGVPVMTATQCIYGEVNPDVYTNLRILYHGSGATPLGDMLPETAYVKLGWVLGHTNDVKKAKEMMLTNHAGELGKSLQPDMFLY